MTLKHKQDMSESTQLVRLGKEIIEDLRVLFLKQCIRIWGVFCGKDLCEGWPRDNMFHECSTKGVCLRREENRLLLAVKHYLIAGSIFWAGLGFGGRGRLGGPVRVNAELLGQTHVSGLGRHLTLTATPGQTLVSWVVDAPLEITKPPKHQMNKLKRSFFIAGRSCLRAIHRQIQTRRWHANVTRMQTTQQRFLIGSCAHLWLQTATNVHARIPFKTNVQHGGRLKELAV